ncbi:MAG: hypothetical protein AB1861_29355 [Cyanobacteriota bacterium]
MTKKYYRIQPRVTKEKFEIFQRLARKKGTDMSKLTRQLIDAFIDSELAPKPKNRTKNPA